LSEFKTSWGRPTSPGLTVPPTLLALTQIRREIFGGNFPGSALITVTALAIPEAKVEIQGYAVVGS
jgi:hypothetical protein